MKKGNAFQNIFKTFGLNIAHMFIDFGKSFKYNPSKIAGYLVAIPGIIIGFALNIHAKAIANFQVLSESFVDGWAQKGLDVSTETNYSGFFLFVLMLVGCINLFNAVNIIRRRNLASAISSLIMSGIIILFGIFFISYFFHTDLLVSATPYGYSVPYINKSVNVFSSNSILSIVFIIASMVTSLFGSLLAILKRNKSYKKDIF